MLCMFKRECVHALSNTASTILLLWKRRLWRQLQRQYMNVNTVREHGSCHFSLQPQEEGAIFRHLAFREDIFPITNHFQLFKVIGPRNSFFLSLLAVPNWRISPEYKLRGRNNSQPSLESLLEWGCYERETLQHRGCGYAGREWLLLTKRLSYFTGMSWSHRGESRIHSRIKSQVSIPPWFNSCTSHKGPLLLLS